MIFFLLLFIIVAGAYTLGKINSTVTRGFTIAEHEERLIELDNSLKEARSYYIQSALSTVEKKAIAEGFVYLANPRYIEPGKVVASR